MAQRIRRSVAAVQSDVAVTLDKVRKLIDDLHDGVSITLVIAGKTFPVKIVIDPREEADKPEKG